MRAVLQVLGVGAVVAIGACQSPGPDTAAPFKPVADLQQLMETIIDPAADAVWGAVGTIIDQRGTTEIRPQNDEEWASVRRHALLLAESGNLLMIGDRPKDDGPWMIMSQALVDAGAAALAAADAKDPAAIFAVGEQIYDACETCHVLYW